MCSRPEKPEASSQKGIDALFFPPLRIPKVDAAMGWLWLADFGQGNLATAREAADAALKAREDVDSLFALAVVNHKQGNYRAALPLYETAFQATVDMGRQRIIISMARLCQYQRGTFLPDGLTGIFPGVEQPRSDDVWVQRLDSLGQEAKNHALVEGIFISNLLCLLPMWCDHLADLNTKNEVTEEISSYLLDRQQTQQSYLSACLENLEDMSIYVAEGLPGALWCETQHSTLHLLAISGERAKAIEQLEQLSERYVSTKDSFGVFGLARCYLQFGDWLSTSASLGHPLLMGYRINPGESETSCAADPDLFDSSQLDIAAARGAYEKAFERFQFVGALRGRGMVLLRLGYLSAREENWNEAIKWYAQAQTVFVQMGDFLLMQSAKAGEIWIQILSGKPYSSLATQVREFASRIKERDAMALGLSYGSVFAYAGREALTKKGDVEIAVVAARCAELVFKVLENPLLQAQTYGDRASTFTLIEAQESAEEARAQSLRLLKKAAKDGVEEASKMGFFQTTQMLVMGRNYAKARYNATQSQKTAEWFIDRLETQTEEPVDASPQDRALATWLSKSIETLRMLLQFSQEYYIPIAKGREALVAGDREGAKKAFNTALAASELSPQEHFFKAMVYMTWQQEEKARTALDAYIAAGMPSNLQINLFDDLTASISPTATDSVKKQQKIAAHENLKAFFIALKEWSKAQVQLNLIDQLSGSSCKLGSFPTMDEILSHSDRGVIALGLGEPDAAKQYTSEAIEAVERKRRNLRQDSLKRAFSGNFSMPSLYKALAKTLIAKNDWSAAFTVADKARAQVLSESMSDAKAAVKNLKASETHRYYLGQQATVEQLVTGLALARQQGWTAEAVNELESKLEKEERNLDMLAGELIRLEPGWQELFAPTAKVMSLEEVSSKLSGNTLMLAYFANGASFMAWAITSEGVSKPLHLEEIEGKTFHAQTFLTQALQWSQACGGEAEKAIDQHRKSEIGRRLSHLLVEPFETQIQSADHIVVVPFAELNLVPFEALAYQGSPLGLQKPISYLPAASLLQHFRDSDPLAEGALVVGNPENMSYRRLELDIEKDKALTLDSLPAAEVGAEIVAKMYRTQALIGKAATEPAVRAAIAQHPKIIHLFTHGYIEPEVPLASGVALAQGNALSADEFMGLDIKADVVILSACDTGQGKLQGSELNGLARSILYAGARAVVVSQWKANDIANTILMELLHQQLLNGNNLAAALHTARQQLCEISVEEALALCQRARDKILGELDEARMSRTECDLYIASVLADAEDCKRAAETYQKALIVLRQFQSDKTIQKVEKKIEKCQFLAEEGFDELNVSYRPFNSPYYWAPYKIIGDWQCNF
ncbi:MAG: CHAT domain-containing protein [Phormidesmis sp.]